MERIYIFDTTLRDGEQSPGASMSVEQKYEVALQLARLGVDVIEAGFPVSSPQQFDGCRLIAEKVRGPVIAGLARAVEKDLERACQAVAAAERPRVHTFIASSPIHMKHKLNKQPEQVIEMATWAVRYARQRVEEVEFSPEDATRSELPFLCRLVEEVIKAGARIVNIPDTVGYAVPEEFGAFVRKIMEGVPNMDKAVLSVHCHNDLGLGVANSIAAVQSGARQVELTVNGIGERAGNAALEEFVMALNVRKDLLPFTTGIDTRQIYNSCRMLANIIGFPIPRNKPVVGENAFAHEAGIHQDGVLKHRSTYEIMTPEDVGRDESTLVLGRHSGKHGFLRRLEQLGLVLPEESRERAYQRFLDLADRKREVYDDDIFVIVRDEIGEQLDTYTLSYFNIYSGNMAVPTATVRIESGSQRFEEAATGDGPVDAVFNAIDRVVGANTKLLEYTVHAVTPGREALGEVSVTVEIEGRRYVGRGASTDILEASARAYLNSINRYKTAIKEAGKDPARGESQ
ncbi:MAG: 2-isopropylmalate synthase [Spirochaetales bacterium]|nr:2-isopropylmalate synthase [Spirochaetales bacterium]